MSKLSDLLNPVQPTPSPSEVSVKASEDQEILEPLAAIHATSAHPTKESHPESLLDPVVDQRVNHEKHSTTTQTSVTSGDVSTSLEACGPHQNLVSSRPELGESQETNNQLPNSSPSSNHSPPSKSQNVDRQKQSPHQESEHPLSDVSESRVTLPSRERVPEHSTQRHESGSASGDAPGSQTNNEDTLDVHSHHRHTEITEPTSGPSTQTIDDSFTKRDSGSPLTSIKLQTDAIPFNLNTQPAQTAQQATPTVTSPDMAPPLDTPSSHTGHKRRVSASVKGTAKRGTPSSKTPQAKKKKPTKSASKPHPATSTNGSNPSAPAFSSPPAGSVSEDSGEDDIEVFCICRGPDDHTRMICCDSCDDWFHIRCVTITEERADIIDKYICPNCYNDENFTTYRPLCRLRGCPRPARVEQRSKYCSDEHGREFMRRHLQERRAVPGGALSLEQLASIVQQVANYKEFASLGNAPPHASLPAGLEEKGDPSLEMDGGIAGGAPNSHRYSAEEWARVGQIRWKRKQLVEHIDLLRDKQRFLAIVEEQVDAEADRVSLPSICGFDRRLSWSLEEFAAWRATEVGQKALKERSLPHDRKPRASTSGKAGPMSSSVCYEKRCQRHHHWETIQERTIRQELLDLLQQDNLLKSELNVLTERARVRRLLEMEGETGGTVEVLG
ncbi:MAG: hypothetical protein M1816_004426 [Peltula sp. TS41687]|nr:MAG: hypothetical protein M1816_004426 [Peltula sp. TS41687]